MTRVVLLNVEGFKLYCIVLNMYNHELLFLFQGRVLHLKMQSKLNAGFCTSIISEVKERTTHGSSLVNTKSLFIIMSITKVYTSRLYKHQHNETWEIPFPKYSGYKLYYAMELSLLVFTRTKVQLTLNLSDIIITAWQEITVKSTTNSQPIRYNYYSLARDHSSIVVIYNKINPTLVQNSCKFMYIVYYYLLHVI